MGKWYNEAVFYHMYPLGMTGAPKENKEPETVHRLRELFTQLADPFQHIVALAL